MTDMTEKKLFFCIICFRRELQELPQAIPSTVQTDLAFQKIPSNGKKIPADGTFFPAAGIFQTSNVISA
ncbi:MAG: hypothetical protein J6T64_02790 [Bacteroidaceae bacterium]|nr:hypothetical protein [Bacteroidaceae bacterium]